MIAFIITFAIKNQPQRFLNFPNIYNKIFELKVIILTPQFEHFTAFILNYENDILNLKKGVNYFCGISINHDINL